MSDVKKMDKNVKKGWLKALRSGDYEQAKRQLKVISDITSYCCLGVLCETMGVGYIAHSSVPQNKTLSAAGLSRDQAYTLAGLNDQGKSFMEIADFIENNL